MSASFAEPAVVVGLGNPGQQYERTRHNAGFLLLDLLYSKCSSVSRWQDRDGYLVADGSFESRRVFLVKPQKYMNLSGEPLQAFLNFRKLSQANILVCHDELDLTFGTVRLKFGGGDGGHNGLKSLAQHCGGTEYARIRLGVGRPEVQPGADRKAITSNWVLANFPKGELVNLERMLLRALQAIELVLTVGFQEAQNRVNRD